MEYTEISHGLVDSALGLVDSALDLVYSTLSSMDIILCIVENSLGLVESTLGGGFSSIESWLNLQFGAGTLHLSIVPKNLPKE